jgi:predicted nucleic acid-binding protein
VTVLLDTSVVIDLLRGSRAALDEERPTRRLLAGIEWIAVDDLIAEGAGMLANRYALSHTGIDPMDYIIAATAHAASVTERADAQLWTRNVKHFPMFANLEPPY